MVKLLICVKKFLIFLLPIERLELLNVQRSRLWFIDILKAIFINNNISGKTGYRVIIKNIFFHPSIKYSFDTQLVKNTINCALRLENSIFSKKKKEKKKLIFIYSTQFTKLFVISSYAFHC